MNFNLGKNESSYDEMKFLNTMGFRIFVYKTSIVYGFRGT